MQVVLVVEVESVVELEQWLKPLRGADWERMQVTLGVV